VKLVHLAAALSLALIAVPALADDPTAATPAATSAAQPASAFSVQTTPISDIVKNDQARAVLEAALPQLKAYYDRIGAATLAQLAPRSNGLIDDAKLAEIQAGFDKIH